MARGNDAKAAAAEFESTYGVEGNAEKLIKAHRRANSRELRRASLQRLDPIGTNALDLDKVEKGIEDLPDGAQVVSAAVRGGNVVAVVEYADGRTKKHVLQRGDAGLTEASLKKSRESLGMPQVPVGEAKYRDEEENAAVTAAREADQEEAERLAAKEEKRAEAQAEAEKAATKEREKAEKADK